MIYREDMLELTRRMNDKRTHLMRLAGAYMDEEGYIDGTFNTSFLKLEGRERSHALSIAKTIPFSRTNEELISLRIPAMKPESLWQLLYVLRDCELKNDALLLTLYEILGEHLSVGFPYAIYMYYGCYDIIGKSWDKAYLDESEEMYRYLVLALCPVNEKQEAELPFAGLLYPAFTNRSTDTAHANLYSRDADEHWFEEMKRVLKL